MGEPPLDGGGGGGGGGGSWERLPWTEKAPLDGGIGGGSWESLHWIGKAQADGGGVSDEEYLGVAPRGGVLGGGCVDREVAAALERHVVAGSDLGSGAAAGGGVDH